MLKNTLLWLGITLFLSACGAISPMVSSHSTPSVDFNQYQTFGFFDKLDTDRRYESLLSQYLKQSTTQEMKQRGFTYTQTEPDLLINFSDSLTDKQIVRHLPTTRHGGYYNYNGRLYVDSWIDYEPYIDRYQQDRLTIDIVDRKQNKMIWQGIAVKRVYAEDDDEALETSIPKVVAEIFKQFPRPVEIIE